MTEVDGLLFRLFRERQQGGSRKVARTYAPNQP
jgi:hypothetical protein